MNHPKGASPSDLLPSLQAWYYQPTSNRSDVRSSVHFWLQLIQGIDTIPMVTQKKAVQYRTCFLQKTSLQWASLLLPSLLKMPDLTFTAGNVTNNPSACGYWFSTPLDFTAMGSNSPKARNQRPWEDDSVHVIMSTPFAWGRDGPRHCKILQER